MSFPVDENLSENKVTGRGCSTKRARYNFKFLDDFFLKKSSRNLEIIPKRILRFLLFLMISIIVYMIFLIMPFDIS